MQVVVVAIAIAPLVGCGAKAPTLGAGPDILDQESPFATPVLPPRSPQFTCSQADRDAATAVWTKLRKDDYPYHLQAVALSPPFPSGCRALIIAEPPPTLSLADLKAVAPRLLAGAEIQQHTIGYDGWSRDVVVTLPVVGDAELKTLLADLHVALFGTAYRMSVLDTATPAPAYDPAVAPLDIAIGPGELRRWLLEEPTSFTSLGSASATTFKDLLASRRADVYLDETHGLIVWTVPRGTSIAELASVFRQFTLESDLIVGAMASPTTVAIVARQRAIDPRVLPPLRFETASLLAAAHSQARLQQSYDRTNLLAGKLDDQQDWAPIFLSPELIDTEYGSLLNIADQFLKSWSENGTVRYVNFNYPSPRKWAFAQPVSTLTRAESFRFNWNTANTGAVIAIDHVDVFWLRRTGALHVSYFVNESQSDPGPATSSKPSGTESLEEQAYQFFAETQTPMLARVVQYNALFQIFARFDISSAGMKRGAAPAAATRVLVDAARTALRTVLAFDAGRLRALMMPRLTRSARSLINAIVRKELEKRPPQATVKKLEAATRDPVLLARVTEDQANQTIDSSRALASRLSSLKEDERSELAKLIADPRGVTEARDTVSAAYRQLSEDRLIFSLVANPNTYMVYAEHMAPSSATWIHTPSVVLSHNEPPYDAATGGHDLEAAVTRLEFHADEASVAAEEIAARRPVEGVGVAELDRLELGPRGPTLAAEPSKLAARAALGIANETRFWAELDSAQPAPIKVDRPPGGATVVTKQSDGYRVVDHTGAVHELTTMPEVVDTLGDRLGGKGKSIELRFEGFHPDEVRGVVRNLEIRTQATVTGVVESPRAVRQLDFSKAIVRDVQTRSYDDGAHEIGHVIEVESHEELGHEEVIESTPRAEAPKVARNKTSVHVVVGVKAPPGLLNQITIKINELLRSLIARFSGRSMTPQELGVELRKELLHLMQHELRDQLDTAPTSTDELLRDFLRIEIKMQQDGADFLIVHREERHGARAVAG
ncbi:MAG TPA: hypothetical protein VFP84_37185 [Kofleriaceae bacterium]|nr:hypothetical protein [Kofleriaceae bacterium]